jgi:hypothetical protein
MAPTLYNLLTEMRQLIMASLDDLHDLLSLIRRCKIMSESFKGAKGVVVQYDTPFFLGWAGSTVSAVFQLP